MLSEIIKSLEQLFVISFDAGGGFIPAIIHNIRVILEVENIDIKKSHLLMNNDDFKQIRLKDNIDFKDEIMKVKLDH